MKTSHTLVLTLVLLYINASTEWPMHTVCKEDNLEIHYQSCDPQQDFAFSIDRCSDITTHTFNIRAAIVLRHSIKELYVNLALIVNGKTVLTYSETLCRPGHAKLIFCGKKKGEHLYYEGPVTLGIKEIPQGDYTISAKLTNEDHVTVGCADFTVKNYLDY
ncbi:Lymphocyte antigen 86 [Buceros rhinoceros silvestris]|uniref:Lymphocyte antigen 86 n=1 Tax=Buceros rhinoceros silvestris TaxID=175836 RepID=A0A091HH17_BUCRH|nr:PREDICTED: lymphocyte antigen 86 [Buceros rhinoceros silvestris]KFO94759.1 Lymphocyte antigen 86 [Buceros rhinoceros silvestris]